MINMYALYNGPLILSMHEELTEVIKTKDEQPAGLRPFLIIAEKDNGCWKKLHEHDLAMER